MAQLILIKTATEHAEVGDLVSIHEDGTVNPDSIGYKDFTVVAVPDSIANINASIHNNKPEVRRYDKSNKVEALTKAGIYVEVAEKKYKTNFDNGVFETTIFR